jgi:hypothetical protein
MPKHKYAYQEKLREQVSQWQAGIDRLKEHLKRAGDGTRQQVEHQIRDLQAKQKAARRKLDQLERLDEAGDRVGRAALKPARATLHGLRRALQRIVSGFK